MEETSSDDSSSNDSFLFESDELVESKVFQDEVNIRQNGIKRKDYRRTKKRAKSQDPWLINYWSQNLAEPTVRDPYSRNGLKFRRYFRISFLTFEEIVLHMKARGEREFN